MERKSKINKGAFINILSFHRTVSVMTKKESVKIIVFFLTYWVVD